MRGPAAEARQGCAALPPRRVGRAALPPRRVGRASMPPRPVARGPAGRRDPSGAPACRRDPSCRVTPAHRPPRRSADGVSAASAGLRDTRVGGRSTRRAASLRQPRGHPVASDARDAQTRTRGGGMRGPVPGMRGMRRPGRGVGGMRGPGPGMRAHPVEARQECASRPRPAGRRDARNGGWPPRDHPPSAAVQSQASPTSPRRGTCRGSRWVRLRAGRGSSTRPRRLRPARPARTRPRPQRGRQRASAADRCAHRCT